MTETAKTLSEEAREPDPSIDQLWVKEAEERLAAYRRGEIKAVSLQEALEKYRVK